LDRVGGGFAPDFSGVVAMTRYRILRAALCVALVFLGCLLTVLGAPSADAQEPAAALDLGRFIEAGAGYRYLPGMPDTISLDGPGQWVRVRGPTTIQVTRIVDLDAKRFQESQFKLESGSTAEIACDSRYQQVIVRLLSVDATPEEYSGALMQLVFGEDGEKTIDEYVRKRASPTNQTEAQQFASAVESAFRNLNGATHDGSQSPNIEKAAALVYTMAKLSKLRDSDGRPLFSSLQTKGVQKVLGRMAFKAAQDERYQTACASLLNILTGIDMAQHASRSTS
jgi:hypothetical protein